jgi:hypothetical protein
MFDRETVMVFVSARRRSNVAELTRFRIQCDLKKTREPVAVAGALDSFSKEKSKEGKEAAEKAKGAEGENVAVQAQDGEERKEGKKREDEKASEKKDCETTQPPNQDYATSAIDIKKQEIDLTNSLIQDGVNVDGLSATATFQLVSFSRTFSRSYNPEDEDEDHEDDVEAMQPGMTSPMAQNSTLTHGITVIVPTTVSGLSVRYCVGTILLHVSRVAGMYVRTSLLHK